MPLKQIDSQISIDSQSPHFSETPTLVSASNNPDELAVFNMPTELITIVETAKESGDTPATPPKLAQAPENDQYRVTHEIGAGGYGTIWYGVQDTLQRRVALKSLKTETANTEQFERLSRLFKQEALTTAYLQHPNVVPVYDLSKDNLNRPIVVMKLVEGRQWNRVLAEEFAKLPPLEFLEQHLPVLISVAQAVAFAHSRGIIHRDLKPSQVMIGNYGEVLLMDWGLAMAARDADGQIFCDPAIIVDAQSPLVKPLTPAGTPGYMAPEQTQNDIQKLGPWTDVYLMGAILYELLTGYRPHASSPANTDPLDGARSNKIIKPEARTPERDIPGQLSQLAMKAMASRPSERVPSASAFANELKDYIVKAGRRGESMALVTEVANSVISKDYSYEHLQTCLDKLDRALAQWPENQMATYLRHQVLVTFSRMALTNHDLKLSRLQAERLQLCHERSNILKEIEAAETDFQMRDQRMTKANNLALAERERAENLVRFLLIDLQNDLRSVGRADLVYKVAAEALQFFDSLTDEKISQNTLHNRCIAYLQIGNVLSEQGRRAEAEAAYNRALEHSETLVNLTPSDRVWKKLLAECLDSLGRLHYVMGRMELASTDLHRALVLRKDDLAETTNSPESQKLYAMTIHDLALVHWRNQELDRAMADIAEAVSIGRKFHSSTPAYAEYQSDLARLLNTQSNILREMGQLDEATKVTYESLSLRIALHDQFPGSSSRAEDVYWVRANLGLLQLLGGDLQGAIENLRHDLAARRLIYEKDTSNVLRSMGLTFQLSLLAEANFLLHKTDEAERLLSECLVHSRRLAEVDDTNPGAVCGYALHLVQMGELLASRNRWSELKKLATTAIDRARYSYWLSPRNSSVFRPLVQALALYGRVLQRNGEQNEIPGIVSEARDVLRLIRNHRNQPMYPALEARLKMLQPEGVDVPVLLSQLRANGRLDPYLLEWARELNIKL